MLRVIIPYRDRAAHLRVFLPALRAFLRAQGVDAHFVVVEQAPGRPFNRGRLLNAGFHHTGGDADGYCFHDVDMIPLVSDYRPAPQPTHLAGHAEQFGWRLPYPHFFGGVTLFDPHSFRACGGFPNEFWGWGGEDDALFRRAVAAGLRPCRKAGVYRSLPHDRPLDPQLHRQNLEKLCRLDAGGDDPRDGVADVRYRLLDGRTDGDVTHLVVAF